MTEAPSSRAHIKRALLAMAASAQGLTWRRAHDTWSGEDRIRAKAAFQELTRSGQLHTRTHGRQTWYFSTAALAKAWTPPPEFNPRPVKTKPAPQKASTPVPTYTRIDGYTHDPRYQIKPGAQVPALFTSLPMGRYLED